MRGLAHSPLGKVSAEIRNEIWEMVIDGSVTCSTWNAPLPTPPAITKVCQQVREETLLMFYSRHEFDFLLQMPTLGSPLFAGCGVTETKLCGWLELTAGTMFHKKRLRYHSKDQTEHGA